MSLLPQRRVLLGEPISEWESGGMEFRLTYAGPLYATQRDARPGEPVKHAANKHDIRLKFHKQLKELWKVLPALAGNRDMPAVLTDEGGPGFIEPAASIEALAAQHALFGFNFVPLVTQEMDLLCELEILFLRPDRPGKTVWAGDIDNRIKTLLDALRIPEPGENYSARTPTEDEQPLFVLLQDDKLITRISVETDRLLEPIETSIAMSDARLVITVRIKPYGLHMYNMHYA